MTGDQVTYAKVGAKWLFDQLKGKGDVYQMRGIDGAPGDGVRQSGFDAVLKDYPGIKVVATTFMDWSNEKAAQQMSAMLASGKHFDGVWTSGIDYTVIEAIKAANKPFMPFVGADNNGFFKQLIDYKKDGLIGIAVSNSPAIGAAGLVVALDVLQKKPRDRVTTVPTAWYDNTTDEDVEKLKALYDPNVAPTDPVYGPDQGLRPLHRRAGEGLQRPGRIRRPSRRRPSSRLPGLAGVPLHPSAMRRQLRDGIDRV